MSEHWKKWLAAAINRAIRTVAQSALSMIGVSVVLSDVDWKLVISAAVLAGIASLLTSVATGLPEVEAEEEIEELEKANEEE